MYASAANAAWLPIREMARAAATRRTDVRAAPSLIEGKNTPVARWLVVGSSRAGPGPVVLPPSDRRRRREEDHRRAQGEDPGDRYTVCGSTTRRTGPAARYATARPRDRTASSAAIVRLRTASSVRRCMYSVLRDDRDPVRGPHHQQRDQD